MKNYCLNQYDVSNNVRYFHSDSETQSYQGFQKFANYKLKSKSMKTKKETKTKARKPKLKTAVLYTRVANRQVKNRRNSCSGQEEELREYCRRENIKVVRVYHEFFSGKHFDRPEFKKFLGDLNSGKVKPDLLLCTTWDRFSRNFADACIMIAILEKSKVRVKAIKFISQTLNKNLNNL